MAEVDRHTARRVEGTAVFNASAVLSWLDFAIFTRTLCGTRYNSAWGDMESQEMHGHSSAVITQRYLHELDGRMAACFEGGAQHHNNRRWSGLFHSFASFLPIYNTKRIDRTLRSEDSSDDDRRHQQPLTSLEKTRFMVERFAISCNIFSDQLYLKIIYMI